MGRAGNKRDVFNKIKALDSTSVKLPKQSDSMSSINNSKEMIPFLLDTLKVVAGTGALKILIGGLLTKVVSSSEPKLKSSLKKQFTQSNSDDLLPNNFKTTGVNIPVKNIDTTGKLKTSPSDVNSGGNIIYGNPSNSNFDYRAHDSIRLSGQPVSCNNLTTTYNPNIDGFIIKPDDSSNNSNVGSFFNTYIDKTELINSNEIVGNTMDSIFGTIAKSQNKTTEQILDNLIVEKMLEQVLNGDDSFNITTDDNNDLSIIAQEMSNGVLNYDMGCGIMGSSLSLNSLNDMISTISGSTDPFLVGNAIENALNESVMDSSEISDENKETINDSFFQKLINKLMVKMLQAVTTSTQVRMLMGVLSSIQNNGDVLIGDVKNDIKNWKIMIKCMAKEIMILIAEFIFSLIISYLMKLLLPIIKRVVKEQVTQFVRIMKSFSGKLGSDTALT